MMLKYIKQLIYTLLLGGLLFSFWKFELPPLYDISLRFDDINYKLNKNVIDDSILFVSVDEKSVNKLGRWPWDRKVITKGLEYLTPAQVVIFDMVFSEPTNESSDQALAESMSKLNSICGFFLRHKATEEISQSALWTIKDSEMEPLSGEGFHFVNANYVEANIEPILESCTMQATFATLRDDDHLMRHYPLGFTFAESTMPSLGIQALRLTLNQDLKKYDEHSLSINDRKIEVNYRGFTRLNFYPLESYKIVSFIDLMDGKIPLEAIKGKKVILGITEAGVEDIVSTPIGAIPGPLLHYTFLSNYAQGDLLTHYEKVTLIISLLFLVLPLFLTFYFKKIALRVLINLSLLVLFIAISKILYIYMNIWIDTFFAFTTLLTSAILSEIVAFRMQEKESRFIQNAFSSYLSPILLNKLKSSPELLTLGGETKEMTIFFSDIRSFTTISESMTPEKLVGLLNRYFTPMAHIVREHEGMLDKYIGDAIMAFFNAPLPVDNHPEKACRAALAMMEHLGKLNKELATEGMPPILIGIGLNTAKVIVGNMGSDDRFNYTVIGDGVNLASRVEGLTKNYHVNILITEFTRNELSDEFLCRRLEAVKVKGKNEAVLLYELMPKTAENSHLKEAFEAVLLDFEAQRFDKASKGFKKLYDETKDPVSQLFYEKSLENVQKLANHEDIETVKFINK